MFKKGQSGNPGGRPLGSGLSITNAIKIELGKVPKGKKATNLVLLVKEIFKQAIKEGDQNMIRQIWNHVDGMPKQSQEFIGEVKVEELTSDTDRLKFAPEVAVLFNKIYSGTKEERYGAKKQETS